MAMPPKPHRLMLQGTSSDVGKSLLTAGLCRAFANRGLRVRPFKAQNISNNGAVTVDYPHGHDAPPVFGEIGRAQAFQARACRVAPSIHMNPVLLKPQAGVGSQVVLQGQVLGRSKAKDYAALRPRLFPAVLESFALLEQEADLILVEGGGSPVETHLNDSDIVNMALARALDLPVLMVGDVDRGGALAALIGTYALIEKRDRPLVKGYLVNKLRGDLGLFAPACDVITRHTQWPCVGMIRWFDGAGRLPGEDSLVLDRFSRKPDTTRDQLRVVALRLPHLSNFDDFDPLLVDPSVDFGWVLPGNPIPRAADVIILPGSKATLSDLRGVYTQGWHHDLHAHVRAGGRVLGICGGYQMLGTLVNDPHGIEGPPGSLPGLGLLEMETTLQGPKKLSGIRAVDTISDCEITGYEMHMGCTLGPALEAPLFRLENPLSTPGESPPRPEGATSHHGLVQGTYIHGLFSSDAFRTHWIRSRGKDASPSLAFEQQVEDTLDDLAAHLEKDLDLDALLDLAKPA